MRRRRCIRLWPLELDAWLSRISLGALGCVDTNEQADDVQQVRGQIIVSASSMDTRRRRRRVLPDTVPRDETQRVMRGKEKGWSGLEMKEKEVGYYPMHQEEDKKSSAVVTIVAVEYNDETEIGRMQELASSLNMQMWLVRKGRNCDDLAQSNFSLRSALFNCSEHHNVGREQGSFLQFVSEYYDILPPRLILTAIDIDKFRHSGRNVRRDVIVRSSGILSERDVTTTTDDTTFICYTSHSLRHDADLSVAMHGVTPQYPAKPSPLAAWVDAHMGQGTWKGVRKFAVCLKGTFYTTSHNIRARPRDFYLHLAEQVNVDTNPEAGHFMERLDGLVFGAWHQDSYRATARLLCSSDAASSSSSTSKFSALSSSILNNTLLNTNSLIDCAPNATVLDSNRRLRYGVLQRGVRRYFDNDLENDALIPRRRSSSGASKFVPGLIAATLVLAAFLRCWRAVTTTRRRRSQTARLGRDVTQ